MRDTIDMMREACDKDKVDAWQNDFWTITQEELKAFEALVRADEAAKYTWDVHSCGPTCTKAACVAMREAVGAEREACAKVCEQESNNFGGVAEGPFVTDFGKHTHMSMAAGAQNCAAAIRARGETK